MLTQEVTKLYYKQDAYIYANLCYKQNIPPKEALLLLLKSDYYKSVLENDFLVCIMRSRFDFIDGVHYSKELGLGSFDEIHKMLLAFYELTVEGILTNDQIIDSITNNKLFIFNDGLSHTESVSGIKSKIIKELGVTEITEEKIKHDIAIYCAENGIADVKKEISKLASLLTDNVKKIHNLNSNTSDLTNAWLALQIINNQSKVRR